MKYRETFKLTYVGKPSYQIDYENQNVKCHLTVKIITPDALFSNKIMDTTVISTNGYSKCDENDIFNVEIGKKIALARAEEKIYLKAKNLINQAAKDAAVFARSAEKFEDKCYRVCAHNDDYVDQFCFASHPSNKNKPCDNKCSKKEAQPRDAQGRFMPYPENKKQNADTAIIKIRINRY